VASRLEESEESEREKDEEQAYQPSLTDGLFDPAITPIEVLKGMLKNEG
jgi:hypothetical protein